MINVPKSTTESGMKNFMKFMYPAVSLSSMNIRKRTAVIRIRESNILRTKALKVIPVGIQIPPMGLPIDILSFLPSYLPNHFDVHDN